jgi:thiol-disulfide isomerase/thioredoxin
MVTLQAAFMAMLLSNPGQVEMLDFYAEWCAPCRAMTPTIEGLEAKGYNVRRVDISKEPDLAKKYKVSAVPCYVMLVNGEEVERVNQPTSFSRLERMFKTATAKLLGTPMPDPLGNVPTAIGPTVNPNANPPAMISDPNVAPATAVMPQPTGNFAAQNNRNTATNNGPVTDAQLLAVSVRIRVEDPAGHSCGSGTIIDARGGRALIVTCGHIFRDSKGNGKIEVELFGPHAGTKVQGRMESYDSETRDVGLISIQMPEPAFAARLAPPGYAVRQRDPVASVGCDHGADPTVRRNRVNASSDSNLWVDDQPTEGRSGGGLFSAEGYVIGVCNGCDPRDREGLYAPLGRICAQLDQVRYAFVYQSPQGWEKLAGISSNSPANPVPSMPTEMPGFDAPRHPREIASSGISASSTPSTASPSGISAGEQAAMDELRRHLKDGAEIVCVIRPRNVPGAKSEVVTIDKASPELVRMLSAEARGLATVQPTSMDTARPRKKLIEWSIAGDMQQKCRNN